MKIHFIFTLIIFLLFLRTTFAQNIQIKGQASSWVNYNPTNKLELWGGLRYIPQVNGKLGNESKNLFDIEASANLSGIAGSLPFDSIYGKASIKPYRLWARYSNDQLEIRAGLQKINFGSATMIRPLMWFDKIDPRDPLQMTDGVWGILGRYYFLNNANLWLWVLYGNEKAKTWELGNTSLKQPEFGGRIQYPLIKGEIAVSYHHRLSDTENLFDSYSSNRLIPENRLGIDAKWDLGIGFWFEATWISKSQPTGFATNQEIASIGADYTFDLGNGLNMIFEQLLFNYNEEPFIIKNPILFSTLSLNYPIGLNDNLNAIFYYDWTNNGIYNLATWNHQMGNFELYCMGYVNPRNYRMPLSVSDVNLFAGTGIQLMVVWNH